jgi:hypothetical protein
MHLHRHIGAGRESGHGYVAHAHIVFGEGDDGPEGACAEQAYARRGEGFRRSSSSDIHFVSDR